MPVFTPAALNANGRHVAVGETVTLVGKVVSISGSGSGASAVISFNGTKTQATIPTADILASEAST